MRDKRNSQRLPKIANGNYPGKLPSPLFGGERSHRTCDSASCNHLTKQLAGNSNLICIK